MLGILPDFANSERMLTVLLYDAADAKTQRKVNRLANKLDSKYRASKGCYRRIMNSIYYNENTGDLTVDILSKE